jgi:octaprenyl-diphosphate synthase
MCYHLGRLVGMDGAAGLLDLAVATELIHSASLLHDDVVDAGALRRGRPTVNALWGNTTAVLAGDLLLSRAITQLAGRPPGLTQRAILVVAEMTRASVLEVRSRGRAYVDLDAWRLVAAGKTGALFGLCGFGAGVLAGEPALAGELEAAARHLGVAFQIADDLHDLFGGVGKDALADVRQRTPSYALVLAASRSESVRATLTAAWAAEAVTDQMAKEVFRAVAATDAVERCLSDIRVEVTAARVRLGRRAEEPHGAELLRWGERLADHMTGQAVAHASGGRLLRQRTAG